MPPDQKWKAIFSQCYQQLGIPEPSAKNQEHHEATDKLWQNVAVVITKSTESNDHLNKILCFGKNELTLPVYKHIHKYLIQAFESPVHPLGQLLNELTTVYTTSYGGVRAHPLLLKHAVAELQNLTSRVYEIMTMFFPALPPQGEERILIKDGNREK